MDKPTMRAAVVERYGGPEVVRVVDVPVPTIGRRQVLVRVIASAVTSGDARIRAARFPPGFTVPARLAFGVRQPRRRILGGCFSGVVEVVGDGVEGWAVGDEVCGMTGARLGTHAECVAVPARRLVVKPLAVSHADAAGVVFGGTTAWCFLHDRAKLGAGESVLVNGASGAVGTNAVQLAKHLGASVTAVTSAGNAALVTELGADRVIDYRERSLSAIDERFDVVFDTVGSLSIESGRRLLRQGGRLILAVAGLGETIRARGNVFAGSAPERTDDIAFLLGLVAGDELRVVIDRQVTLEAIADGHRRVDSGRKVGNVVVVVDDAAVRSAV